MDTAHGTGPTWSRGAVAALALVQVWVLTAATARLGLSGVERSLFTVVFALPEPLVWPFRFVMPLGSFPGGMVLAVLGWGLGRRTGARLTLAVPLAWAAATATKAAVSRGRPAAFVEDLVVRATADGPGYPSGHTAVAVALAAALWPDLGRRGRVVVAVVAAMVAVARVLTGVHLPLDLVGGAAVGALAGLGSRRIVRRAWHG